MPIGHPKERRTEDLDYLVLVRRQKCLVPLCDGKPDAHHLTKERTGTDYNAIPLDRIHHTEIHQLGINGFEQKYGINVWREAFDLFHEYVVNHQGGVKWSS